MPDIIAIGDSIVWGAWDPAGGWVQRLRTRLDKKALRNPSYRSRVYNLGLSADTSAGVLKRFEREVPLRLKKGHPATILIGVGLNDSQYDRRKKRTSTPLAAFRKNIAAILRHAKRITPRVIFIGFTPVDEKRTTPVWWDRHVFYTNELIEEYASVVKEVCKSMRVPYIDLLPAFPRKERPRLFTDGAHPNARGHEKICRLVTNYLAKHRLI
ncbi:MAG: GDSL-type esterase/lipase family protein [Patescibacteria group bacterium]